MSARACDWCGALLNPTLLAAPIVHDKSGAWFCSFACAEALDHALDLKAREDRQYVGMPGGPGYPRPAQEDGGRCLIHYGEPSDCPTCFPQRDPEERA